VGNCWERLGFDQYPLKQKKNGKKVLESHPTLVDLQKKIVKKKTPFSQLDWSHSSFPDLEIDTTKNQTKQTPSY